MGPGIRVVSLWYGDDSRHDCTSLTPASSIGRNFLSHLTRWHERIGDPTIGDAILDRVVHRSHRIELKGPSLCKRHAVNDPGEEGSLTSTKEK